MTAGTSAALGCRQISRLISRLILFLILQCHCYWRFSFHASLARADHVPVQFQMWPLACLGQMSAQKPDSYKPPPPVCGSAEMNQYHSVSIL